MDSDTDTLRHIYDRFNARDIDGVLAVLADDVSWATGWMAATSMVARRCARTGLANGRSSVRMSSPWRFIGQPTARSSRRYDNW